MMWLHLAGHFVPTLDLQSDAESKQVNPLKWCREEYPQQHLHNSANCKSITVLLSCWTAGASIMEADDRQKWPQFSQSNHHSTIGIWQNEYHKALPSPANAESHLTSSFANGGTASWYLVCRVPMVDWRLDCENCRHLTIVSLHDTGPWSSRNNYLTGEIVWHRRRLLEGALSSYGPWPWPITLMAGFHITARVSNSPPPPQKKNKSHAVASLLWTLSEQ